jgi:hypothetical protein
MNENGGSVAELEVIKGIERLNVKLDELLRRGDDHEARLRVIEHRDDPSREHAEQLADLQTRMRAQEKWRWQVVGALAAAGVLGGGAGASVTALLGLGGV